MSLPRVAVLLASYNGSAFICEQLDSILNQENVHVHVFVSDDLSEDDTVRKISSYPASSVSLLPAQKAGGAAQNFFRLLLEAPWQEFDFVALADQDDIWHRDKLSRACTACRSMNLAAYSSNVTAFWPDGRRKLVQKAQPQRRLDYLFEAAGPGNTYVFTAHCAEAIFQKLNESSPLQLEKIALHDWLYYAIVREVGLPWYIDAHPSLDYRQHQNNVFGTGYNLARIRRKLGMLMGDWYVEQLYGISKVAGVHGPEVEFLHRPSPARLAYMLRHLHDYRRKKSEAAMLGLAFTRHTFRKNTTGEKIR